MEPSYETPSLPLLLTTAGFLYLINVAESVFTHLINAGLVGSLVLGIIFGPQAANLLPIDIQSSFIVLGYIGLILIVFEAGLTTNISLLFRNLALSASAALTGVILPISFSLLLLHFGYGYTPLQGFGAGAALCSTSLGTTLALLRPELRQTRVGSVLMSAALLDDIAGLVITAIIPNLSSVGGNNISWRIIIRPILASFAFAIATPLLAYVARLAFLRLRDSGRQLLLRSNVQLFLVITTLSAFVAGARYAGTSELFGACLAGAFLAHVCTLPPPVESTLNLDRELSFANESDGVGPHEAFTRYILPSLQTILSPIFFASIGIALPIRSLVSVGGSHRVIWRGIIYSFLMIIAKALVGVWMLIWSDPSSGLGWFGRRRRPSCSAQLTPQQQKDINPPNSFARPEVTSVSEILPSLSAALLGLAMVARGEIALIVAQLARPLLIGDGATDSNSEAYAVVIWAILVTTIAGALGVGLLLRRCKFG